MTWDLTIQTSPACEVGCAYCPALGFVGAADPRSVTALVADHDLAGSLRACGVVGDVDGVDLRDARLPSPGGPDRLGEVIVVNLAWPIALFARTLHRIEARGLNAVAIVAPGAQSLDQKLDWLGGWPGRLLELLLVPWPAAEARVVARQVPSTLLPKLRLVPITEDTSSRLGDEEIDRLASWLQDEMEIPEPLVSVTFDGTAVGSRDLAFELPEVSVEQVRSSSVPPRLSVVVATCVPAPWIVSVFAAIGQQRCSEPWELVVAQDGEGTIDLRTILANLSDGPSLVRIVRVNRTRAGFRAGIVRNAGARHAHGDGLLFLDHDLLTSPGLVQAVVDELRPERVLQGTRRHLSATASSRVTHPHQVGPLDTYVSDDGYWDDFERSVAEVGWHRLDHPYKYVCSHSLAMPRALFEQVGRFRRRSVGYGFEDTELGYRLWRAGAELRLVGPPSYHFEDPGRASDPGGFEGRRTDALGETARQLHRSTLDPSVFRHFSFMMGDRGDAR